MNRFEKLRALIKKELEAEVSRLCSGRMKVWVKTKPLAFWPYKNYPGIADLWVGLTPAGPITTDGDWFSSQTINGWDDFTDDGLESNLEVLKKKLPEDFTTENIWDREKCETYNAKQDYWKKKKN